MSDLMLANSTYASGTNDTASTLTNNVSVTDVAQMNGVASACVQIETVLGGGTTLIGSKADLATRLGVHIRTDGSIWDAGDIKMSAAGSPGLGWLLCDGSAVSRATYAALFVAISTTYGTGDGSTTFNLPNPAGRVPIGVGTGTGGGVSGTGAISGGSALTAVARGTWKGEETHTLSSAEMPSHTHTIANHNHTIDPSAAARIPVGFGGPNVFFVGGTVTTNGENDGGAQVVGTTSLTPSNTGGSLAHNTIQPVIGFNFFIKT